MEAQKKSARRACAAILAAAALWGVIGIWNRRLMAAGLSPPSLVTVRHCGGMVLLGLVLAVRDRSVFRVRREHLKYFFGTGVVSVVLFTACYFSCQKLCSLSVASVLLYTAPSFVVLLSALLWRERVTGRKLAALGLTLVGCALVCGLFSGQVTVTAAPYLLYTWGLARVESGRTSILASLEPVVASLAGTLLFHEPLSAATLAGIACVLAGVSILR